jgi:hypothetical protein
VPDERERTLELLAAPTTWALLALADGELVAHVSFTQATERHAGEQPDSFRDRPVSSRPQRTPAPAAPLSAAAGARSTSGSTPTWRST